MPSNPYIVDRGQRRCYRSLGIGLMVVSCHAMAQQTVLGQFGDTELQRTTGDAVQTVCGGFVQNQDASTPEQVDLFDICGEMVQTAYDLADNGLATGKSLELDEQQLAQALQEIAGEELIAPDTVLTETLNGTSAALFARLSQLRAGQGSGLASVGLLSNDQQLALRDAGQLRGGSAGDDLTDSRWGMFATALIDTGDVDASDREDGFDFDTTGLVAGVDYRLSDSAVIGLAASYNNLDVEFDRSATVSGGDVDADGYGLSLFGSWYQDDFYLTGLAGFGRQDYDLSRRIVIPTNSANPANQGANRTADADTDSDYWTLSLGAGYELRRDALTINPYLQLDYLNADIDGYQETGALGLNLEVDDQEVDSLVSVLGTQVSMTFSQDFGIVQPYARAEWRHEFQNDQRTIRTQYRFDPRDNVLEITTDEPDRNYYAVGLGVSAVFQSGLQGFVGYDTLLGLDDVSDHLFSAGVR